MAHTPPSLVNDLQDLSTLVSSAPLGLAATLATMSPAEFEAISRGILALKRHSANVAPDGASKSKKKKRNGPTKKDVTATIVQGKLATFVKHVSDSDAARVEHDPVVLRLEALSHIFRDLANDSAWNVFTQEYHDDEAQLEFHSSLVQFGLGIDTLNMLKTIAQGNLYRGWKATGVLSTALMRCNVDRRRAWEKMQLSELCLQFPGLLFCDIPVSLLQKYYKPIRAYIESDSLITECFTRHHQFAIHILTHDAAEPIAMDVGDVRGLAVSPEFHTTNLSGVNTWDEASVFGAEYGSFFEPEGDEPTGYEMPSPMFSTPEFDMDRLDQYPASPEFSTPEFDMERFDQFDVQE